jgi:branched-chain amino acid transport system substrate-binding protein
MTLPQTTVPMAQYAFKKGYRKIYTLVADYGPGHDSEKAFKAEFTKLGGQVVGESRVPLKNPEFGPYVQRIKDSKPEAIFVFVTPGEMPVALMKAYTERGLDKAGIKLLSTGDVMDDSVQDVLGATALGVISTHQYSVAHKSPENKAFLAAYAKIDSGRPNYMAVGGYDGPRGPITIDAGTRDVVQNIYVREVKKVDGHFYNVEFETFPQVRDPGK